MSDFDRFREEADRVCPHMTDAEKDTWARFNAKHHVGEHSHPEPLPPLDPRIMRLVRTMLGVAVLLLLLAVALMVLTLQAKAQDVSGPQPTVTSTGGHLGLDVNIVGGGGSGGTASSFASSFPATGTAAGFSDGVNMKPGLVDGSGFLKVNCSVGCSGSSFADNAAFTAGTTAIGINGGVFNDGLAAVTSGNAAAVRITSDRMMYVNLGKVGGSSLVLGQQAMASSVPVVLANNQSAVSVAQSGTWNIGTLTGITNTVTVSGTVNAAQSGTWTVQPGNTANTTPWLVDNSTSFTVASGQATASGDTQMVATPGVGHKIRVFRVWFSNSSITTDVVAGFDFAGGTVFNKSYLPNSGGSVSHNLIPGYHLGGDNQALNINLSAVGQVEWTVYYVVQ